MQTLYIFGRASGCLAYPFLYIFFLIRGMLPTDAWSFHEETLGLFYRRKHATFVPHWLTETRSCFVGVLRDSEFGMTSGKKRLRGITWRNATSIKNHWRVSPDMISIILWEAWSILRADQMYIFLFTTSIFRKAVHQVLAATHTNDTQERTYLHVHSHTQPYYTYTHT